MRKFTHKPWGWFLLHEEVKTHKVKTIYIKPNQRFSLQYHKERTEQWVVVQGVGFLTQNDSEKIIRPGEYCFIPKGEIHRLRAGNEGVTFVEVQQGICKENDIVRMEDDYGRIDNNQDS
tara:strand:+ start:300 stop:656 length:357 start_codon:yes stop_codon:yes gene_type:complete